jgi:uncharacterized protein (DUF885 family)
VSPTVVTGSLRTATPLSRFQTSLCEISGYSEGWGLYAERFMDELGAFDRPATRLGSWSAT